MIIQSYSCQGFGRLLFNLELQYHEIAIIAFTETMTDGSIYNPNRLRGRIHDLFTAETPFIKLVLQQLDIRMG